MEFGDDLGNSSNGGPDIRHKLLIFADFPEPMKEGNQGVGNDDRILFFGPGYHYLNGSLDVSDKREVYVAPGAWVEVRATWRITKKVSINTINGFCAIFREAFSSMNLLRLRSKFTVEGSYPLKDTDTSKLTLKCVIN